jgi:hypothetical protein
MKRHFTPLLFPLLMASLAQADVVYNVSMNTSSLVGNGPFTIDLQFIDGTGLPADLNNNTVMVENFQFGAGSASGGGTVTCSPPGPCGVTGSLASGVTLKDNVFFNEYDENFTPGGVLSFKVDTTNNLDPSGTPDEFSFAILDSMGNELPTTGPASEFMDVTLTGAGGPVVSTYGSVPGAAFSVAAPVVQSPLAVPEPSVLLPLGVGLGVLVFAKWRTAPWRSRLGM